MEGRTIVCLSGGKASAYCAKWAFDNFKKEKIVLYFNDTKWEHEDLYRFIDDISEHFSHPITIDEDGRSPEQLFYDNKALANNRMPFCSRILKAERLQKFYQNNDVLVFGIGNDERHRAERIVGVYQKIYTKTGKFCKLRFPLIEYNVSRHSIDDWLRNANLEEPFLYKLGFEHNNCSGGCVRAGKKQWMKLYKTLPDVYRAREKCETDFIKKTGKNVSFFKDETLEEFRERIERGDISSHYNDEIAISECIGICGSQN